MSAQFTSVVFNCYFFLCQYVKKMLKTGDTEADKKKHFLILNYVPKITIGNLLMSPKFFKNIVALTV